ncbi:hypothetical protein P7D22_07165 [Lichenihabitans sp. Uapishka_5]|uniref:hypothetical protein n=1 Tax=Lichenihabitans sp. Uapishka_5 TaxID=3037302 RepID=UPI0029E8178B|nr:hypothetical protein [Lichenihabitans sp. Uapishka_5]MDX7950958.1 hypothetical protein [Lichenihabitans sp. Uapishka_5]
MIFNKALMLGGLLVALSTPTFAQNAAAVGAADGAAAGGAVGALVGGVTGAAVGTAAGVTGAIVGAPAVEPVPPTTTRRSTCVTAADGSQRCDSVETTN